MLSKRQLTAIARKDGFGFMNQDKQIEVTEDQFRAYVNVQMCGAFNMLDPRAREATGLSKDVYMAILKQYGELQEKYGKAREI